MARRTNSKLSHIFYRNVFIASIILILSFVYRNAVGTNSSANILEQERRSIKLGLKNNFSAFNWDFNGARKTSSNDSVTGKGRREKIHARQFKKAKASANLGSVALISANVKKKTSSPSLSPSPTNIPSNAPSVSRVPTSFPTITFAPTLSPTRMRQLQFVHIPKNGGQQKKSIKHLSNTNPTLIRHRR